MSPFNCLSVTPAFRPGVAFRTGVLALFLMLLATSCFRCDPPVSIDNGKIPDSILTMVPYQSGQTYKFRHSGGSVIGFIAGRQSREEWLRCEHCCDYIYKYEVNHTSLTPDYPIFSFSFELGNLQGIFSLSASVGYYWFMIPINDYQASYCGFADSVLINDKYYRDVFKIKSTYGSAYDKDPIFADSLYYSYKNGIIQILMSNGEKYSIYE